MMQVKKMTNLATIPTRGSAYAAGFDLSSAYDITVPRKGKAIVKTDLAIAIPVNTYARIAPRSGLAVKNFIDVGAGVVDYDYRGNVGVVLFNHSEEDFVVSKGDRIAQLILESISMAPAKEVQELDETDRGAGGFGSTGIENSLQEKDLSDDGSHINGKAIHNTTKNADSEVEIVLKVKKLTESATIPTRGSKDSAGFDLSSAYDITVPRKGKAIVKTDLAIAIPVNTYARIAPRSGLAVKNFIDVGAGVVDYDYRGNVGVVLFNHSEEDFIVSKGDRIAQVILESISMAPAKEVQELNETDRGAGGFGSTGIDVTTDSKELATKRDRTVFTFESTDENDTMKYRKLTDQAYAPGRGSKDAAGFDLSSAYDITVPRKGKAIVKTDLAIAIPVNTYARIAPRSGLAVKNFIDVGAGVVDYDYRGNVGVVLFNHSEEDFVVSKGDRIAQLILERISMAPAKEVQELDETDRGAGGFGSTGIARSTI